jgi:hypothetical protein
MKAHVSLILLAFAACGEADSEAVAPPATPGWPEEGVAAAPLDPAEIYRMQVAGRWSEQVGCAGMTWNFQADSFTTPGEVHCAQVDVAEGPEGAVRVTGRQCTAEGAAQPDLPIDIVLGDNEISVTGVGNAILNQGWTRCE